jgi:hypothetical protein
MSSTGQGSAHLKFFLDRIGIGSVALNIFWIGSVASNFFWIGSGSERSPQIFFGSDRDRIGLLKMFLDRIGIGSGSDRLAQKKNWIGSGSDRNWIGFPEKSISAHC